MQLKKLETPLSSRSRAIDPTLIVLHATAGATAKSSIDHLRSVGLSYHYIIARDGKDSSKFAKIDSSEPIIFHCVDGKRHAFHVGSTIPAPSGQGGIAKTSIGISLANIQSKTPEPYPPKQLAALEELLVDLKAKFPSLKWLTTHAVCQPWNRADPAHVEGNAIAKKHGFIWWVPTPEQIKKHTPK
jgi:N-acetyl-anhydromuramyl-L-alanine amidase AmpD